MIIDCDDPESLARFWCELLDLAVVDRLGNRAQYVDCGASAGATSLGFQRVPENKNV